MAKDLVIYNGVPMHPDWPARIEEAQHATTYVINGEVYDRTRYGDESSDWHADKVPCHDCGVIRRQYHVPGCDVEECPGAKTRPSRAAASMRAMTTGTSTSDAERCTGTVG